ncbi:MAG: hypothetical protein ACRDKE_01445, partial [Solirubrobacterales bacterium]
MNRSRLLTVVLALALTCLVPQVASAGYGDLDADFGSAGKIGSLRIANPSAVETLPDRKVVIAGGVPSNYAAGRIARLLRNGALDTSFGTEGYVSIPGNATIHDTALLKDERIAVVTSGNKIMVFRSNGSLDSGFASGGVLEFGDTPTTFKVASIAAQGNSKLLVSGSYEGSGLGMTSALFRYGLDGTKDSSFGTTGVAEVPNGRSAGPGYSPIALTPDGDILLGLESVSTTTANNGRPAVAKFTASGGRILAFGESGIASDPQWKTGVGIATSKKIVVARDGRFVVLSKSISSSSGKGGGSWRTYMWSFYGADGLAKGGVPGRYAVEGAAPVDGPGLAISFARNVSLYKPDMTLDDKFALNGTNSTTVEACSDWDQLASDVSGSIVAAGSCDLFGGSSQVARFLGPNGGLPAPQVRIYGLSWSRKFNGRPIHRSWPRVLTGEALPSQGLDRVAIAIKRVDRPLAKKGLCGWLINAGKQYSRRTNCSKPVFMKAKGLNHWRFDFARPLPPGNYHLYARAYMFDGRFNPINQDLETYKFFTVKHPA